MLKFFKVSSFFAKNKIVLGGLLSFLFLFVFSSFALAQVGYTPNPVSGGADSVTWAGEAGNFQNRTGLGNDDPRNIIANIINISLGFLGILAIIIIIYAGFLWMMSGGNSDKIAKAKKVLLGGVIGLVIILSSFAIASFVLDAIFRATTSGGGNGNSNVLPGPGGGTNGGGGGGGNGNWQLSCSSATDGSCTVDQSMCDYLGPMWTCNDSCQCVVTNMGSCYNPVDNICDYPCHLGLECYGASGCDDNSATNGACTAGDTTCQCCCSPTEDHCGLIYPTLSCRADQGNCTGASRGLCCGCDNDNQCGGNPNACGDDTCCHPRPNEKSFSPDDNAVDVCTNSLISVEFDQAMKPESLADNLLLVGEYNGPCPPNTSLIDVANDASILLTPQAGSNYCRVNGSTRARNINGNYVDFIPSNFLDVDHVYYIVVRGDLDLNDNQDEGIESYWGVSMGVTGEISHFKTINDLSEAAGVCTVESVSLLPAYRLFRTGENSVRENDTDPTDPTFDSDDKDKDKVFVATAITASHQTIVPMTGYNWDWAWHNTNGSVVDMQEITDSTGDNYMSQVGTHAGASDGRSIISASIDMSHYLPTVANGGGVGNNTTDQGNGLSARSNVFVFICNNPWPPVATDGSWHPWEPNPNLYNYDIYYCRDKKPKGTADDLPAFDSAGIVPPDSNNILQQVYFSYQAPPAPGSIIQHFSPDRTDPVSGAVVSYTGGTIFLSWEAASHDYSANVAGYKVYWGTKSGSYSDYKDVGLVNHYNVTGLNNGQTYYFSVTAYTADQAESSFYKEVTAIPQDVVGPSVTVDSLRVVAHETEVELSWDEVEGVYGYQISYGLGSDINGVTVDAGNYTEAIIESLTPNTQYSFAIRAVDEAGNAGSYGSSVAATTLSGS